MAEKLKSHTESIRGEVGQGIYSLRELKRFVAYEGKPEDADSVLPWLTRVLLPVAHRTRTPDYSFHDLISLFVVRELRRAGVTPASIRDSEAHFRRLWNTDRPFARESITTDGRDVYPSRREITDQLEAGNRGGQQVMFDAVKDLLKNVRYDEGWATAWAPAPSVLLDPRVQFGEPVVVGTRIPTRSIAGSVEAVGVAQTATMFALRQPAVRSAVRFEERLEALQYA
jgi:uncharacterized protein (DUF433 family)